MDKKIFERYIESRDKKSMREIVRSDLYGTNTVDLFGDFPKEMTEITTEDVIELLPKIKKDGKLISSSLLFRIINDLSQIYQFAHGNSAKSAIFNPFSYDNDEVYGVIEKMYSDNPDESHALEEIIDKIYSSDLDANSKIYGECLVRLYYRAMEPKDLIQLKEEDIDFSTNTIRINDREWHLPKEDLEILKKVHSMEVLGNARRSKMISYKGGYFKIPVGAQMGQIKFDSYSSTRARMRIDNFYTKALRPVIGENYTTSHMARIGLYNYLISQVGEEGAWRLTEKNPDKRQLGGVLANFAHEYGYEFGRPTTLKRNLLNVRWRSNKD